MIQHASKGQDHASPAYLNSVSTSWGRTICTLRMTEIHQGRSHSPGGDTGEHGRPPQAPSLFHPLPHQDGFRASPSFTTVHRLLQRGQPTWLCPVGQPVRGRSFVFCEEQRQGAPYLRLEFFSWVDHWRARTAVTAMGQT